MEYLVVVIESLIALAATLWAWQCCRSARADGLRLFLSGLLAGMVWCAFLHGFLFGVIRIEGPRSGSDALLLLGYGVVASLLPGIPLGMIMGVVLYLLRRRTGS